MHLFSVRLPWHKALEACVQRLPDRFSVGFKLAFAGADHAGLHFHAQVFGLLIEFSVYDRRHWNYVEDRWMLPGEEFQGSEARTCGFPVHEEE